MSSKNFISFVCMYKMVEWLILMWNKAGVTAINVYENNDVNKTV